MPSLDGQQDNEDSTTTSESLMDDGIEREQQQRRQQGDIGKNKDNEKRKAKENKDVPSLDGQQDNEDSTTTPEALIDDGIKREQQRQRQQGDVAKDKDNAKCKVKENKDIPSLDRTTRQRRINNYSRSID